MSRSKVTIRPVAPGDVDELAANLREADREEVIAQTGRDPSEAIAHSIAMSSPCWTARIDGELAAIFGCAPVSLIGPIGMPWLLGTPVLDRHPRAVISYSRPYLAVMFDAYPQMLNWVDARNERSIRWLKALGFRFHDAAPHGPLGLPFHRFDMGF